MKKKIVLSLAGLIFLALPALGDVGGEGHGGDELRMLFYRARALAQHKLSNLKPCSFQSNVDEATAQWIINYRHKLASDVMSSKHIWLSDRQSTCAFTKVQASADIYLSFPACRKVTRIEEAAEILIHESTHHFEVTEEGISDKIAVAVMQARDVATCPIDPQDPFNPKVCQGSPMAKNQALNYFDPAQTVSRPFAKFNFYHRHRYCNNHTGCQSWQFNKNAVPFKFYGGGRWTDKTLELSNLPAVLYIESNAPDIRLAVKMPDPIYQNSLNCGYVGSTTMECKRLNGSGGISYNPSNDNSLDISFKGILNSSCAWVRHYQKSVVDSAKGSYFEHEVVGVSFY